MSPTKLDKGPFPVLPPLRPVAIVVLDPNTQPRVVKQATRSDAVPAPLAQPMPRGAMPVGYPTPGTGSSSG